jgi:hypothetical protein
MNDHGKVTLEGLRGREPTTLSHAEYYWMINELERLYIEADQIERDRLQRDLLRAKVSERPVAAPTQKDADP